MQQSHGRFETPTLLLAGAGVTGGVQALPFDAATLSLLPAATPGARVRRASSGTARACSRASASQPARSAAGVFLSVRLARSPTTDSCAVAPRRCLTRVSSARSASSWPMRGLALSAAASACSACMRCHCASSKGRCTSAWRSVASAGASASHHSSARPTSAAARPTSRRSRAASPAQAARSAAGARP